jgi:hypothetical protein
VGVGGSVVAAALVVLLWPVAWKSSQPAPYLDRVDDRAAIRHLATLHRPGDLVLLTGASWPAYRWYADPAVLTPAAWFIAEELDECDPAQLARVLAGHDRVLLYDGHRTGFDVAQQKVFAARLAQLGGTLVETRRFGHGAGVVGTGIVAVYQLGPPRPNLDDPALRVEANCIRLRHE